MKKHTLTTLATYALLTGTAQLAFSAQVVPFPAWGLDPASTMPPVDNSTAASFRATTAPPVVNELLQAAYPSTYSSPMWFGFSMVQDQETTWIIDDGILAFSSPGGTPIGGFDTGLQRIFGASRTYDSSNSLETGLLVYGVSPSGSPEIKYSPTFAPLQTSQLAFTTLVSLPQGQAITAALLSGSDLYVFEAVESKIWLFQDTDADGLPNQPSLVAPLQVTPSEYVADVVGFFSSLPNVVSVRCLAESDTKRNKFNLTLAAGTLQINKVSTGQVVYPRLLMGGPILAGTEKVRCLVGPDQMFEVIDRVSGQTLGKGYMGESTAFTEVTLDSPATTGQVISIRALGQGLESVGTPVKPPGISISPSQPMLYTPNDYAVITGSGFMGAGIQVDLINRTGDTSACIIHRVTPTVMLIQYPNIQVTTEDPGLAVLKVSDTAGNTAEANLVLVN